METTLNVQDELVASSITEMRLCQEVKKMASKGKLVGIFYHKNGAVSHLGFKRVKASVAIAYGMVQPNFKKLFKAKGEVNANDE
ncbi:MAG: hypothetical protein SOS93_04475 [Mannheimia varigena]|nr:hypothetical protein [Mannheimia varigena]